MPQRSSTVQRPGVAIAILASLVAISCAAPSSPSSPSPTASATLVAGSPLGGPPSGPASGSPAAPAGSASSPAGPAGTGAARVAVALRRLASGLQAPVSLASSGDGSGRLFVVEQPGRIVIVERDGSVDSAPFLDISDRVSQDGGERGLLGLAFHPGYASDGRLYVDYTARDGTVTVSEFRRRDAAHADPASERVLLRIPHPRPNHNGGEVAFGPDGMLYVGVGDGGGEGDPDRNGQNRGVLLAKILRIDVDHGDPYAIPPGNPFVSSPGARPEVWLWGLRNPWRFSFDPTTGALFVADVGQNAWEEIDVAAPGAGGLDFGWSVMEGRHCYGASTCDESGLTQPVLEYGHDQGCAVIGGAVYRGTASPALDGWYLFSDYCSGRIWTMRAADALRGTASAGVALESNLRVTSFGTDDRGELYLVDASGGLYQVTGTAR